MPLIYHYADFQQNMPTNIVADNVLLSITPLDSQVSVGGYSHGESLVISGSDFGTKSTPAPLIWDDSNHGDAITERWAGRGPSSAAAGWNLDYYVPGTGNVPSVPMPHTNAGTKVMAGAHLDGGSQGGWNVGPIANVPFTSGSPLYVYYLHRRSDSYNNSGDNYKVWSWDHASSGWYGSSTDGYIEWKGDHTWKYNSGYSFVSPEDEGNSALDYMGNSGIDGDEWTSHEWFWQMDLTTNGFGYVIEGNADRVSKGSADDPANIRLQNINADKLVLWYHERTVPTSASEDIYAGIGGYTANYGTGQWRYFTDLYLDNTWSRVILANSATYDSATIVVPQIPTSWSDTEITVTINRGMLSAGTAHVFVFDDENARQYLGTVDLA